MSPDDVQILAREKFQAPLTTAKGEDRATVSLRHLETLWINTGTLCNLTCRNCYIDSSPTNDRLVYISALEVAAYLDEIDDRALGTREIGFTGGEPFMNPDFPAMLEDVLERGFQALVLTNAMKPMMKLRDRLAGIAAKAGDRLTLRVSLDHYTQERHEEERGPRSWQPAIDGLKWLASLGIGLHVAGRTFTNEAEADVRAGYAALFADLGVRIDANDPGQLILFPEMDESLDVPEITTACWGILGVDPASIMCATSRMVIKRKGAASPVVVSCTLLPDDPQFEMGHSLVEASGSVALNHPHCSRFCVLGGASCSAN